MKNTIKILAGLLLSTFVTEASLAENLRRPGRLPANTINEKLVISMYDSHLRGQNKLALKQKIKDYYPNINLQMVELKSVVLVAKTKRGNGTASLQVGQKETYPQSVYGHINDFHSNDRRSYSKVVLDNPSFDSKGAWKLNLKGNFKVSKLVINLTKFQPKPRTLEIKLDNQYFSGNTVIGLKRLIRSQYGSQVLRNKVIKRVTLVAKSKKGKAKASLVVAGNYSHQHRIPGSKLAFYLDSPYTYTKIVMQNPSLHSLGPVQIELNGKVKIDKVIVKLGKNRF